MKKILFLLLAVVSFAHAQVPEDIRFIETSDSVDTPFSLPISIDLDGRISVMKDNVLSKFSLSPMAQFNYTRNTINYVAPIMAKKFEILEPLSTNNWIEIKNRKIEVGIGPSTEIGKVLSLGLVPYKGAMQTTIKHKREKDQTAEKFSLRSTLPKKLEEISKWTVRDQGTYQTYGGIQAYGNAGVSVVSLGSFSFGLQNKFIVGIRKLSSSLVEVKISEEDLKKRQITIGPVVARIYGTHYNTKLFTSTFTFDLSIPEHHDLYGTLIKGRLDEVQSLLSAKNQNIKWVGNEASFYAGIPWIIGKAHTTSEFDIDVDNEENEVDIYKNENRGMFLPLRNHTRLVWSKNDVITLFWSSEMKKTKGSILERRFFDVGQAMGVDGFENKPDLNQKLGSTITQLGLGFTRDELEALNLANIDTLLGLIQNRCEELQMKCRKSKSFNKLSSQIKKVMSMPWEDKKHAIGALITKEPVIVFGIVKTLNLKKEVFFKFLSERFQSIQGVTEVAF